MKKDNLSTKQKLSKRTAILMIFSILWGCFIFWNASRTGEESRVLSDSISNSIKDTVEENNEVPPAFQGTIVIQSQAPENENESENHNQISVNMYHLNIFIRKLGHLLEYGLLAFLVSLTIVSNRIKKDSAFLMTIAICALVASLDEFIQSNTDGRNGRIPDVFIDISGSIIGSFFAICVLLLLYYWVRQFRKEK
jgi:VanZ family protein